MGGRSQHQARQQQNPDLSSSPSPSAPGVRGCVLLLGLPGIQGRGGEGGLIMRIAKGVAGVAAAVIGGLYLLRALFFDAEWHIGITSTSKNIRTTESKDDAGDVNGFESGEVSRPGTVRAGADLAEEEGEEEENNRYAFVVQAPFPFPDGRRAALPRAGGVLKNARSVFAELSAPMLVRVRSDSMS